MAGHIISYLWCKPMLFSGKEGEDKAESWLVEIEKAFDVIELSKKLKVRYGMYMLVEDVESWWKIKLTVKYGNVHSG